MIDADPGRNQTTNDVLSCVRAGMNVTLVGMRASGRSTILRRVREQLTRDDVTVVRIIGLPALRERPLGALAVAGIDVSAASSSLHTLALAAQGLESALSGRPSVLLIDDADDLDDATIGAIGAVRSRLATPSVATYRLGGSSRIAGLATALQPGTQITVAPLRFDVVHQLIHEQLDGPVDPAAVALVADMSGGLPGLVRAIIDIGRRTNRLALRDGRWVVRGELWAPELSHAAEPFLATLDPAGADAVALISLAGTMRLETATQAISPKTLSTLEETGLLHTQPVAGSAILSVFPPLVADFAAHQGPIARRLLAENRLHELAGGELEAADLSDSHGMGRRLSSRWARALEQSRAAWEAEPTPAHAGALLRALRANRAPDFELERVIVSTRQPGKDPLAHALFAADVAAHRHRSGAARERSKEPGSSEFPHLAPYEGLIDVTHIHATMLAGDLAPALALWLPSEAGTQSPKAAPESLEAIAAVKAEALIASGHPAAGLALLDLYPATLPHIARHAAVLRNLAALYLGDIEGSVTAALAAATEGRRALDAASVMAHSYVAGLGLTLQGRLLELDEVTCCALELALAPDFAPQYLTGILTLAGLTAWLQGRVGFAKALVRQADISALAIGPHPGMDRATLLALMADDGQHARAERLWALAVQHLTRRQVPAGIVIGVASMERRPDLARSERLQAAAKQTTMPLAALLADYVGGLSRADAAELKELGDRLSAADLRFYAVHAAVAQALELYDAGEPAKATELANDAWNLTSLRGRDLCGLFLPLDAAVNLSAREREIAVLVARGYCTADIATDMVLSQRTVENHIFNACRKIGADNREGLARAARTWLSCQPR